MIIPAMTGLDFESTDKDPETARPVTAAVSSVKPGQPVVDWHQMCDPGVPIPAEASAIHGITTEQARASRWTAAQLCESVAQFLTQSILDGIPIVGMNLAYDLTLLDRECRRHDILPLSDRVPVVGPVIDVYVIDKFVDQFRHGSRKLGAMAAHYGVTLDGAHDASHDTLAACRVAFKMMRRANAPRRWLWDQYRHCRDKEGNLLRSWQIRKIVERFDEVRDMDMMTLHWAQAGWRAEQSRSLEEHLRRTDDGARVDPWWPIKPIETEVLV